MRFEMQIFKRLRAHFLGGLIAAFCASVFVPAHAQERFEVESITINGNERVTDATILAYLPLKAGDNIILAAFGGGFTWGAVYLKWAYDSKS